MRVDHLKEAKSGTGSGSKMGEGAGGRRHWYTTHDLKCSIELEPSSKIISQGKLKEDINYC